MAKKWHLSLVVVCLVLGLLLATSFNTQERARKLSQTPRKQELIAKIRQLERERDAERSRIAELRSLVSERETRATSSEGNLGEYKRDLDLLKFEAGLTRVKGQGLHITLADNPEPPKGLPAGDVNNYIIHDYDLRQVVNALWSGGAEAISINGERLVNTTAVRCAGNTILVNSTRLASPYLISAIGDQKRMEEALKNTKEANNFMNEVARTFGLVATVERKSLVLPSYSGSLYFKESKVKEGVR
ncbi:MAG: DUF881 domain-containing protein [Actinobacteria bacterium]|nr:DUF881 domain-containing protein [Actinomycetota bacterium]